MFVPLVPVLAQDAQWICEDAVFPVVVEARTAADNGVIEFRIDAGDFRLPPESKGAVSAEPDSEIALGQIVQTIELAEYKQQTTVTPFAREAGTLVEAMAYYVADNACGADAVGRTDALINNGESAKRVCGELSIQVADEPMGENTHFYPSVSDEWTPVATFTVAIESLAGRWEQTDEIPPDGLCE